MLSHCKVIAFTKKRVRKVVFPHPFSIFQASFPPRLSFFVDMILIKQWQKCPIEAFFLEHEVFPQIAQINTDFYLRTRTKGRWPKGKAITQITRIFSHRYTLIFLEQRIKPDCTDYFFTGIIRNWPWIDHELIRNYNLGKYY